MTNVAVPAGSTGARLIDATLESIHRHGFTATSVTTVTDIAGLSRGMVRHEFGSKHQMLVEAMTVLCDTWLAATEPDAALPGPEQVRAIVRAMFAPEVLTPASVNAWVALSVEASSDDALRRLRDSAQERWISQLTGAFAASGVDEPDIAALGLMAAADGLWLQQRIDRSMSVEVVLAAALRVADSLLVDFSRRDGVA